MERLHKSMLVEKTADEIRADKQAWLDRKARNKDKYDAANQAYRQARTEVEAPIEEYVKRMLSKYNLLQFDVSVDTGWDTIVDLNVRCNENNKFDRDSALSWDYRVKFVLRTGEVKKESGSWSGLQATTQAQLDSLKQTVSALEELNSIDYSQLLNIVIPDYEDYFNYEKEDETPEYDYDTELVSQQIRELIGKGKAIRIKNFKDDRRGASDLFLVPVKETAKKIEGTVFSARTIDDGGDPKETYRIYNWPEPIMKHKIKIVEPVQIIDVE